jgi:hypothetical protein
MKNIYFKIHITCFLLLINSFAIYAQSDLYYWGYKSKYSLTTDSLQAVLIPKVGINNLNFQSLNAVVENESVSALANRHEIV